MSIRTWLATEVPLKPRTRGRLLLSAVITQFGLTMRDQRISRLERRIEALEAERAGVSDDEIASLLHRGLRNRGGL